MKETDEKICSSLGGASVEMSVDTGDQDSLDKIVNIHGLERLNLFCTAHKSGLIKIWDHHMNLVKLIFLNRSLGGVYFLNTNGDLLVSLNQHLYIIRHEHIFSSVSFIQGTDDKQDHIDVLVESAVFEDPDSQNGELVSTKHGLFYIDTLQSYLKPYDINLHGPKGLSILDEMLHKDFARSDSSPSFQGTEDCITSITSEILFTPTHSPLLLSYGRFPYPVFSTPTSSRPSTPSAYRPRTNKLERAPLHCGLSDLKRTLEFTVAIQVQKGMKEWGVIPVCTKSPESGSSGFKILSKISGW